MASIDDKVPSPHTVIVPLKRGVGWTLEHVSGGEKDEINPGDLLQEWDETTTLGKLSCRFSMNGGYHFPDESSANRASDILREQNITTKVVKVS